jgi:DNA-binding MarR family transcriptional regulator
MNTDKLYLDPAQDTDVAWARRKETTLAALKMFRMTLDAVRRHSEWVEAHHGISAVELWALWELTQSPGMRSVDLAKAMALPRASIDAQLTNLIKRGLARRSPGDSTDGPPLFFPTFDGQRIVDSSPQYGQGVLKAAMNSLSDASLAKLAQAMGDLIPHLPFREDRAALQPLGDLLRPGGQAAALPGETPRTPSF